MGWLEIIVLIGVSILTILRWKSVKQQGVDEAEEKYRAMRAEDQKIIMALEKENKRLKLEIAQTKELYKDGLQ